MIATLALGIGVNATSVAVAYGILVQPLPYREPSRVVILNLLFPDGATWDTRRASCRTGCRGSARLKRPRDSIDAR